MIQSDNEDPAKVADPLFAGHSCQLNDQPARQLLRQLSIVDRHK
jgi:hypothetical protein